MSEHAPHVTDAELSVMKLLWEHGPLTARRICDELYPRGAASDLATVQKLLQRLETKAAVERDRSGFAHLFSPLVTRGQLAGRQLEALASKLTDGSLVPFMLHAVGVQKLTERQRQEIIELLKRSK